MDEIKSETDTEVAKSEVAEAETESEAETTESEESPQELKARLARAEKKIEKMKLEAKVEKKVESTLKEKSGELDETTLDYLDLKGYTEDEDLNVIQDIVKKTGMSVRQALKDDYVKSKLESNKRAREVAAATPSSTKRSGGSTGDNLDVALAKFERTGELPSDFALRSQVVNAKMNKDSTAIPPWRR